MTLRCHLGAHWQIVGLVLDVQVVGVHYSVSRWPWVRMAGGGHNCRQDRRWERCWKQTVQILIYSGCEFAGNVLWVHHPDEKLNSES